MPEYAGPLGLEVPGAATTDAVVDVTERASVPATVSPKEPQSRGRADEHQQT